jgi:inorganic pyrophosphatase
VFPFDFGFVPGTTGGDGDPLDVLVLVEGGVYPGVVVHGRLIGVIEAEQTERDGVRTRNDRLVAVALKSRLHRDVHDLGDLAPALLDEIEHFFVSYNDLKGKTFTPVARRGAGEARALVQRSRGSPATQE